jgi:4-amino-4-deoxy-L-arabinose transferase-like glycosyltransferase
MSSLPIWKSSGIRFVAAALDRRTAAYLVLTLIAAQVSAWTVILSVARSGQMLNSDSAEAYAWGRLLLWGYGKHPPLTGWIARFWFDVFPTSDWAMYALAMATVGTAAWASWLLALQVVDRRRAMLVVLLLLIYPALTFRGSRFTPDLVLVPMFVLVVLSFLVAYQRRTIAWGIVLGLICACAVLTKYWALLVVGAIGLAAIVHPDRRRFFSCWPPYVAAIVFLVALTPHLIWLVQSDYAPFLNAARHLVPRAYSPLAQAGAELRHHAALLLPVALALAWSLWRPRVRAPQSPPARLQQAYHIWVIAGVLVVLPPLLAVAFGVYFAIDWGTPLYTLLPLAAVALPRIGIARRALVRAGVVWAVTLGLGLVAAPLVLMFQMKTDPTRYAFNEPDVAAQATQLWHERYGSPLPVVAGPKFIAAGVSFYSVDHPVLFTNFDPRIATWIDRNALERSGFLAICLELNAVLCDRAVSEFRPTVERMVLSQQPNPFDASASPLRWSIYLVGPATEAQAHR